MIPRQHGPEPSGPARGVVPLEKLPPAGPELTTQRRVPTFKVQPPAKPPGRPVSKPEIVDPKGLLSNPNRLDFTQQPVWALKMAIEYCTEAVESIPGVVSQVVDASLVKATAVSQESITQLLKNIGYVFFHKRAAEGRTHVGIVPELSAQAASMSERIASYGEHLAAHHSINQHTADLVNTLDGRISSLLLAISSRESAVVRMEASLRRRESALARDRDSMDKTSFFGHIRLAFSKLMKA